MIFKRKKQRDDEKENDYENDSQDVPETESETECRPEPAPARENEFERFIRRWATRDGECDPIAFIAGCAQQGEETAPETSPFRVALRESIKGAEAYAEGAGTDRPTLAMAVGSAIDIALQLTEGRITPESVGMIVKALTFENATALAREEGRIAGRNERIAEEFGNLKSDSEGDGIPRLGGSPSLGIGKRETTIFDVARDA